MMFITGKGTASLSESLSDSIIKKMHEQHAKELADQKAADEERFRKMDEEHRIREAALESRIRELLKRLPVHSVLSKDNPLL